MDGFNSNCHTRAFAEVAKQEKNEMAKIIWKGPIGPDDPIFKQGWVLSNPKLKVEPKQPKNKPKPQQEKKDKK